jgi:hypothetical protein
MVAMRSILEKIFLGREDLKECQPELVQIRNKKMCSSPFRFYRGTANIFYSEIQHLEPASIRLDEPLVSNHALRSITGQKALGGVGDPFLGHFRYEGCDYYCRELSPSAMEIPLGRIKAHQGFADLVMDMGKAVAITHRTSERNYNRDAKTQRVTIDEAVNRARPCFISEVLEIALGYAERVEKDYQAFRGAIDGG